MAKARPLRDERRGPSAFSSTIVFHPPHDSHLPAQRAVTAPQFWQTKV
jgi:hypothetical protein